MVAAAGEWAVRSMPSGIAMIFQREKWLTHIVANMRGARTRCLKLLHDTYIQQTQFQTHFSTQAEALNRSHSPTLTILIAIIIARAWRRKRCLSTSCEFDRLVNITQTFTTHNIILCCWCLFMTDYSYTYLLPFKWINYHVIFCSHWALFSLSLSSSIDSSSKARGELA